jgi:uncharacterized protein (TIGR00266 family)
MSEPTALAPQGALEVELRGRPAFTHIVAKLRPGGTIVAESGAMASMSGSVTARAEFNGGFINGFLLRLFANESLFVNHFTASAEGGELVLTQATPGDIASVELDGQQLCITKGSYIASTPGVRISPAWAGLQSWFAGEGLFRIRAEGKGTVWFGGYGSLEARDVSQPIIVDTGHLVAYDPRLTMKTRMSGGLFSSLFGGEGFVLEISGPGRIFLQSRSVGGLASWINSQLWGR